MYIGRSGNTCPHHQTGCWLELESRRGSARRPAKWNAGRGQVLVDMLADKGGNRGQELAAKLKGNGAGRGQSIPSPPMGRPEQSGRQADTHTKSSLPPPIMMHLDCQGPAVTYSEATSRPLHGGLLSLPLNWLSVTYDSRWQPA